METATEVLIKAQELQDAYTKRFHSISAAMSKRMLDKMLTLKAPCIRYGRRKRRHRLLISAQCVGWKIAIDDGDVAARPITHGELYK